MNNYSNLALSKSKGRIFKEANSLYRTPFQRDRDRIIHCASFRRLKHKTQVFVNTEGDHYRTRITHSIEVAQIARSIAKHLGLNDDLAETLSLAHDLGHTPFGHAGEDSLNECMANFGGFDHNLQTLRIIMFLEHKYLKFKGLNLTLETLDGLLKHNGPIHDLSTVNRLIGLKSFKNKINFTNSGSLEAQISSISDDIAYNNHDLHDGLRAELFTDDQVAELPIVGPAYALVDSIHKGIDPHRRRHEALRRVFGQMVDDVISTTREILTRARANSIEDIRNLNYSVVQFSVKELEDLQEIKNFLFQNMYRAERVMVQREHASSVVKKLFETFMNSPELLPTEWVRALESRNHDINSARTVADYISGMTDRFAQQKYDQFFTLR